MFANLLLANVGKTHCYLLAVLSVIQSCYIIETGATLREITRNFEHCFAAGGRGEDRTHGFQK